MLLSGLTAVATSNPHGPITINTTITIDIVDNDYYVDGTACSLVQILEISSVPDFSHIHSVLHYPNTWTQYPLNKHYLLFKSIWCLYDPTSSTDDLADGEQFS